MKRTPLVSGILFIFLFFSIPLLAQDPADPLPTSAVNDCDTLKTFGLPFDEITEKVRKIDEEKKPSIEDYDAIAKLILEHFTTDTEKLCEAQKTGRRCAIATSQLNREDQKKFSEYYYCEINRFAAIALLEIRVLERKAPRMAYRSDFIEEMKTLCGEDIQTKAKSERSRKTPFEIQLWRRLEVAVSKSKTS